MWAVIVHGRSSTYTQSLAQRRLSHLLLLFQGFHSTRCQNQLHIAAEGSEENLLLFVSRLICSPLPALSHCLLNVFIEMRLDSPWTPPLFSYGESSAAISGRCWPCAMNHGSSLRRGFASTYKLLSTSQNV